MLGDYSVITAPYAQGTQPVGVLGVIGPTRMAYERVIPLVDITARLLTAALSRLARGPWLGQCERASELGLGLTIWLTQASELHVASTPVP